MILEGKKLTAFDAMEEAVKLSELYVLHKTHRTVNFRFSQTLEAITFEFGYWKGFDYELTDRFTIYLDETTVGDTFATLFEKIASEMELVRMKKELSE